MTEAVSWPGLIGALLVPWLCGTVWVACLLGKTGRHNASLLLGHGFFAGYFAVTLVIRGWDSLGLTLGFLPLLTVMLSLSLLGVGVLLRSGEFTRETLSWKRPTLIALTGAIILLCLVAWRYGVLAHELLLRPLFGWDSWMNWVPKAIVWYHHSELVEFVSPKMWLELGSLSSYTLGNAQSWDYPISVPLIQLWAMLGAGTWDHPAVFMPWLMAPACLGLVFYGHLRLAGVSVFLSVAACYVLLNMPYVNVHGVLAGYADLWLGAVFGAAVCCLYELGRSFEVRYALLCLLLAAFCASLKVPGMFIGLIAAVMVARTYFELAFWKELALLGGLLLVFVAICTVGVAFELPQLGPVVLSWEEMRVGWANSFQPRFHPVQGAFFESFFKMINWHLLFYLCVALALTATLAGAWRRRPGSELLALIAGLAFVISAFMFTGYHSQATNFVAVNRALLHIVPALVFVSFLYMAELFKAATHPVGTHG